MFTGYRFWGNYILPEIFPTLNGTLLTAAASWLHTPSSMTLRQYRLVGVNVNGCTSAQPTQPGLEDGYVWLMKNFNQQVEVV